MGILVNKGDLEMQKKDRSNLRKISVTTKNGVTRLLLDKFLESNKEKLVDLQRLISRTVNKDRIV